MRPSLALGVLAVLACSHLAACKPREQRRASPEPPRASSSPTSSNAPSPAPSVAPSPSDASVTVRAGRLKDLPWVASLHRAKDFTTYDVRIDGGTQLDLHWRLLAKRRRPRAPADEEYASLYTRGVTLVVGGRTIALGDHSGSPESADLTYCRAIGFRPPPDEYWSFPDTANVVASFDTSTFQGSAEWLVLDSGGDRLYVLGRHTHDGACPKQIKQGPLEVCADMQWERRFDLVVGRILRVRERITVMEDGGETDFDCAASFTGERLLPPQP